MLNTDLGLLILRLAVGGLMLPHGIHKLIHGIDGIIGMTTAKGLPEAFAYGVYAGEVLAPILIIIGLWTRPAALLEAFTMVVAIYLAFGWGGFALNQHGGITVELNLLYLLGAVTLFFTGSGAFSVRRGRGAWD